MKVPLPQQIEEAERSLSGLYSQREAGGPVREAPFLQMRIDRAEAIVLTLRWLQVYEPDFRQYMRGRSNGGVE